MAKTYAHEDFDPWSMEETPGECMYFGSGITICGEKAVRFTELLHFHDGCRMIIWACADEKHQPTNVPLQSI